MHFTKFFSVVERALEILNPTSHEKLMLLADSCSIRNGDRVLDVGSGKGYMVASGPSASGSRARA